MAQTEETCPYCSAPVAAGPEALRCRACGARHHRDCWHENGGCAVVGCDEVARATARDLPTVKSSPTGKHPPQGTSAQPPVPGGRGGSVFPWIALLLAGMAGAVVITLLVLGGGDDSSDPVPPPPPPPPDKPVKKEPNPSARELLEEQGYINCGGEAFRKDASPELCAAVATEVRLDPRGGLYRGIFSEATGYTYDMNCRPGNAQKVLQRFLFCTKVGTNNPSGISAGGEALVAVGT